MISWYVVVQQVAKFETGLAEVMVFGYTACQEEIYKWRLVFIKIVFNA
jgi:hypothetical protein